MLEAIATAYVSENFSLVKQTKTVSTKQLIKNLDLASTLDDNSRFVINKSRFQGVGQCCLYDKFDHTQAPLPQPDDTDTVLLAGSDQAYGSAEGLNRYWTQHYESAKG